MIMVIGTTALYETMLYVFNVIQTEAIFEFFSYLKILLIEVFYNAILTIIIYPIIKILGYKLENTFEEKVILTRFF